MVFSYAMWILIILDHRDRHVNSFPTGALLFEMIPSFSPSARSILSFLNGIHSICPKLPLFSCPPTLFLQGLRFLNQVSIYSCEVSSLFSINVLIRWSLVKMLTSFKFIILHYCFFSGGSNSSFQCWSYSFPRGKCFLMPVHLPITHLLLFICSRVLKISQKICVSILNPFKLFGDCYLIQAI